MMNNWAGGWMMGGMWPLSILFWILVVAGVVLIWLLTNFPPGIATASAQSWAGQIGHSMTPAISS